LIDYAGCLLSEIGQEETVDGSNLNDCCSALAAVHGMRRDSLLLELKLTLKIAQEKGWPVISLRGT